MINLDSVLSELILGEPLGEVCEEEIQWQAN
jgi:hypothetical protein